MIYTYKKKNHQTTYVAKDIEGLARFVNECCKLSPFGKELENFLSPGLSAYCTVCDSVFKVNSTIQGHKGDRIIIDDPGFHFDESKSKEFFREIESMMERREKKSDAHNDLAEEQFKHAVSTIKDLVLENHDLKKKVEQLEANNKRLELDSKYLLDEHNKMGRERMDLKSENERLQKRVEEFDLFLNGRPSAKKVEDLDGQVKGLKEYNYALFKERDELKKEIEELEYLGNGYLKNLDIKQTELNNLELRHKVLQQELIEVKEKLNSAIVNNGTLIEANKQLEADSKIVKNIHAYFGWLNFLNKYPEVLLVKFQEIADILFGRKEMKDGKLVDKKND